MDWVPSIPWNLIHPWKPRRYGSCGQGIAHHCSDVMTDGLPSLDLLLNQTINGGASGERLDWSQTFEWEGLVGGALPILLMVSRESAVAVAGCPDALNAGEILVSRCIHATETPQPKSRDAAAVDRASPRRTAAARTGRCRWCRCRRATATSSRPTYASSSRGPTTPTRRSTSTPSRVSLCRLIFLSGTEAGGAKLLLMETQLGCSVCAQTRACGARGRRWLSAAWRASTTSSSSTSTSTGNGSPHHFVQMILVTLYKDPFDDAMFQQPSSLLKSCGRHSAMIS
eukprot:COSAG04_NODE_264_length_18606_cov_9.965256_21_plen_284_part_00